MQIPSISSLLFKAKASFLRFSVALLFAIAGAAIAIFLIHRGKSPSEEHFFLFKLLMSSYLGMLLFIAVSVISERYLLTLSKNILFYCLGVLMLLLFYFSLPDFFTTQATLRFIIYAIVLHLFIAFAPFIGKNEVNGFWQYNKSLFLGIQLSALYCIVLYIGLSAAIVAINKLFQVNFDGKIYAYLWVVIIGVFNTWFFLSSFPSNISTLETQHDYPKGLKLFTQYVLIPLITVYLLILYAYMAKIILQQQWPEGWVSYLVLFFSVAGILSLLLVHPVRNDEQNKWIPLFSRFFYFALFPLIVLLFFAIKTRISEYGITENRYLVLLLALWLFIVAISFLFSKRFSIMFIPVSLCIVLFSSTFGPWSVFSISLKSQQTHLLNLLESQGLLKNNKIVATTKDIDFATQKEISSVVDYLVEFHGYSSLQTYYSCSLDSLMNANKANTTQNYYAQSELLLKQMGLEHISEYSNEKNEYFDYSCETEYTQALSNFTFYISNFNYAGDTTQTNFGNDSISCTLKSNANGTWLFVLSGNEELKVDVSKIVSNIQAQKSTESYAVPVKLMSCLLSGENFKALLVFKHIHGKSNKKEIQVNGYTLECFIGKKKPNN